MSARATGRPARSGLLRLERDSGLPTGPAQPFAASSSPIVSAVSVILCRRRADPHADRPSANYLVVTEHPKAASEYHGCLAGWHTGWSGVSYLPWHSPVTSA